MFKVTKCQYDQERFKLNHDDKMGTTQSFRCVRRVVVVHLLHLRLLG